MRRAFLLGLALAAAPVVADPIDNCASMLGSLSVELRVARTLPASRRTTFVCPKDTSALLGASKQRIINALGPPDVSGRLTDVSEPQPDGSGHPEDVSGHSTDVSEHPTDASASVDNGTIATSWSYFFTGARPDERGKGIPELRFSFDHHNQVNSISCALTR